MVMPDFYSPGRVGMIYRPDVNQAMRAGSDAGIAPAEEDERRCMLLLIDMQVDFIHPDGSLTVPGAVDDTRRTIEWLYDHLGEITQIVASLDSHIPGQIFYPTWWVDEKGNHPRANTVITHEDVEAGRWRPVKEPEWSKRYVRLLEEGARKQLMIWPYHTMIGSEGHNMMPTLYEAITYHSAARDTRPYFILKGMIDNTEYYSLLEPEIKVPGVPGGELNTDFLETLRTFDAVYIAGQAKSHCVLETIRSLMTYYSDQPQIIDRLHLLIDCTSSVDHPEIDFEAMASETYERFESQGLHLVKAAETVTV